MWRLLAARYFILVNYATMRNISLKRDVRLIGWSLKKCLE
jgi:hypothetical protein